MGHERMDTARAGRMAEPRGVMLVFLGLLPFLPARHLIGFRFSSGDGVSSAPRGSWEQGLSGMLWFSPLLQHWGLRLPQVCIHGELQSPAPAQLHRAQPG